MNFMHKLKNFNLRHKWVNALAKCILLYKECLRAVLLLCVCVLWTKCYKKMQTHHALTEEKLDDIGI